jgi:hypothetical protein
MTFVLLVRGLATAAEAHGPINYPYRKATANNTPNATPCFISDHPQSFDVEGFVFVKQPSRASHQCRHKREDSQ